MHIFRGLGVPPTGLKRAPSLPGTHLLPNENIIIRDSAKNNNTGRYHKKWNMFFFAAFFYVVSSKQHFFFFQRSMTT